MILTTISILAGLLGIGLGLKKWRLSGATSALAGHTGTQDPTATTRVDTEFSAEIVRVTRIERHPNADRLEIIRFEMKGLGETSYEVVSQVGTFQVGDLAAYFSVDCILPLSHPDFSFLGDRLDGKGKTHYRLRAARLRGVFSQGLLVPLKVYPGLGIAEAFGDQIAQEYDVTYHVTPSDEPRVNTGPGKKAPAVQPMPVYGVDSLKKNARLFADGDLVLVTEKIHGTNFRFGWLRRKVWGIPFGWRFVVGSHRTIRHDGKPSFYESDIWSEAAKRMNLAEKTKGWKGYVFYGELYGRTYNGQAIQDMTYGCEDGPGLAIFDVRKDEKWLSVADRGNVVAAANLLEVPTLGIREFSPGLIQSLAEGKSTIDAGTIREGVVVEALSGPRRKAKYVSETYLTRKVD